MGLSGKAHLLIMHVQPRSCVYDATKTSCVRRLTDGSASEKLDCDLRVETWQTRKKAYDSIDEGRKAWSLVMHGFALDRHLDFD